MLKIHLSDGFGDPAGLNWPMVGCLALAWVIIYFCIWKGVKSTGKVMTVSTPAYVFTFLCRPTINVSYVYRYISVLNFKKSICIILIYLLFNINVEFKIHLNLYVIHARIECSVDNRLPKKQHCNFHK